MAPKGIYIMELIPYTDVRCICNGTEILHAEMPNTVNGLRHRIMMASALAGSADEPVVGR